MSKTNSGDNSLVTHASGAAASLAVDTTTLSRFLEGQGRQLDVLKLDIQGGEPAALEGARSALERQGHLVLFTEVSPAHLGGAAGVLAFGERLTELGFTQFLIEETSRTLTLVTPEELVARTTADTNPQWNLVCTKGAAAATRVQEALAWFRSGAA